MTCSGDADGDGICDTADLCPHDADPTQVDLDGDGLGWVCDPVESITIQTAAAHPRVEASIHRDTAAALIANCSLLDPCAATLFAAARDGSMLVRSDSSDPQEAWANGVGFGGPLVTKHARVLFSRRFPSGDADTFEVDPVTRAIQVRGDNVIAAVARDGTGTPLAVVLRELYAASSQLAEPRFDGELRVISSGSVWPEFNGENRGTIVASDAELFVPERTAFAPPRFHVQTFRPGEDSLTSFTPPLVDATDVLSLGPERYAPFCVKQGDTVTTYQQMPLGMQLVPLPFTGCFGLETHVVGATRFFVGTADDANGDLRFGVSITYVTGRTARTLIVDAPERFARFRTYGHDLIVGVLETSRPDVNPPMVWLIRPDGTSELIADDLLNVSVSVAGDVAHVAGVRDDMLIVKRARIGAPTQTGVAMADHFGVRVSLVTSAEGAAIVSSDIFTYIAPSNALTFTRYPELTRISGAARGTNTVIFNNGATDYDAQAAYQGAVFAYDEAGGQPRLTRLTPDLRDFMEKVLDPPALPPSEYFAFTAPGCAIGRIVKVAGTPTLETTSCHSSVDRYRIIGTSPDGALVAADQEIGYLRELIKIGPSGAERVAYGTAVAPIVDRAQHPPLVIGWTQTNPLSGAVCLDEQPRRCWKTPGNATVVDTYAEAATPVSSAYVSQILRDSADTSTRITVVRSIGPGDLP